MSRLSTRLGNDRAIAACICLAAMCVGMALFFQDQGQWPVEATTHYVAALMMAAGNGYAKPAVRELPEGPRDFMALRRDSLRASELADLPPGRLSTFHERHRYLGYVVALTWWLLGLSWHSLKVMLVLLLGISAALLYALFRLAMNRVVSALGALLFVVSPLVLSVLPRIRDFTKAPFMLGIFLLLGLLVARPHGKRGYFRLAVALGVTIGIGLGFRHDFLAAIPAALLVLAVCRRKEPSVPVLERLTGAALMLLLALVVGMPILGSLAHTGTLSYHRATNGLATEIDRELGLGRASYQLMPAHSHSYAHTVRSSYMVRVHGALPPRPEMPEGAEAGRRFLLEYARFFPADLIARAYAAVRYLLGDAPAHIAYRPCLLLQRTADWLAPLAAHFERFGLVYAALALLMLAWHNLHTALLAGFLLFYFVACTTIQFQFRHHFHLAFLPYWCFLFVVYHAYVAYWHVRRPETWPAIKSKLLPGFRRVAVFSIVAALVLAAPFYAARAYQQGRVGLLATQYRQAKLEPLEVEKVPQEDWVLFKQVGRPKPEMPETWRAHRHGWEVQSDYLVAELETDAPYRALRFEFEGKRPELGYFKTVQVGPAGSGGITRFFFPVYEYFEGGIPGESRFRGIALPKAHAGEFRGLYRVRNMDDFPLLLYVTLPPDAEGFRTYKPLTGGDREGSAESTY